MTILIIPTGGTFDRKYDPLYKKEGEGLVFSKTYIKEMLKRSNVTVRTKVIKVLPELKISAHITNADRARIAKQCKSATQKKIVITHGTDTLVETATYLQKHVLNKTIVLTGAMIPYTMKNSDALFNLGSALTAVQLLPAGAYVAMNGNVFPCDKVKKNFKKGIFEEK